MQYAASVNLLVVENASVNWPYSVMEYSVI